MDRVEREVNWGEAVFDAASARYLPSPLFSEKRKVPSWVVLLSKTYETLFLPLNIQARDKSEMTRNPRSVMVLRRRTIMEFYRRALARQNRARVRPT